MRSSRLCFATLFLAIAGTAFSWDYEGHRAVNLTALESLPPEFPAFIRDAAARERIAFLAGEPDRWRNVSQDLPLKHASSTDHFIDFEDLTPLALSPETLSDFRHIYTSQVFLAREKYADRLPPIDPARNRDRTRELPGYLPWAITESYSRLKSAFSYLKAYEEAGTAEEIENAKANVIYLMGLMGHYVGDGGQPLHTTKHFNGWVGENPKGYFTERTFHAKVDGAFIQRMGGVSLERIFREVKPAQRLATATPASGRDPIFEHALRYLLAQLEQVEPLYILEKDGKLDPERAEAQEGLLFIEKQISTAGHMLGCLWLTAWHEAPTDTYLRGQLFARRTREAK